METPASSAIGFWRAAWLLNRIRRRRQWNQLVSAYRRRKGANKRTATGRKSSAASLFAVLILLIMVGNLVNLAHHSVLNIEKALGETEVDREVKRGWLGVNMAAVTRDVADRLALKPPHGVLISGLLDGGGAGAAGLLPGDVIVKFDGKDVRDWRDLRRFTLASRAGAEVAIGVARASGEEEKIVKLGIWPDDRWPMRVPIAPALGMAVAPGVLNGAALEMTLLLFAALFAALASREFAKPDWDLEWLATLPLPLPTLIFCRMTERIFGNSWGFFLFAGFLSVLGFECGHRWFAVFYGLILAFPLLLIVGALQTMADTGLRLSLPPAKLKNLQAVVSAAAALPLLFAMSTAFRDSGMFFDWAAAAPLWASYLPPGLAVRAIAATDFSSAASWTLLMVVEAAALTSLIYALVLRQLRNGVVAVGATEGNLRTPIARQSASRARSPWKILSAVQRRELRLLGRDRTFMTQTLVTPLIIVGAQIFVNARGNILAGAIDSPANLGAVAFILAAYTLMFSAFQTINAEGQALWILYCTPQSLENILRQKAALWAAVATFYVLVIFAIAVGAAGYVSTQFLIAAAVVLAGAPIFAVIATALGVFGSDPLAQDVQRRVRPIYVNLYMILASLYAYAIYASTIWQRLAMIVLTSLLALALWQKARDQFDYLLDPTVSPPARVSTSDGLIAALMFFVLQGVVVVIFHLNEIEIAGPQIWIAFSIAGAVTYAATRIVYLWTGAAGVPRFIDLKAKQDVLWGLAGGGVAALIGLVYLEIVAKFGWFASLKESGLAVDRTTAIWFGALAVVAAPIFEEFIFRGLIFGGLRRSLGVGAAAVASAAIFAIVHPPMSVIPVFFLGLCAALVYERTKVLAAPMAAHALYNAVILGFQWGFAQ